MPRHIVHYIGGGWYLSNVEASPPSARNKAGLNRRASCREPVRRGGVGLELAGRQASVDLRPRAVQGRRSSVVVLQPGCSSSSRGIGVTQREMRPFLVQVNNNILYTDIRYVSFVRVY